MFCVTYYDRVVIIFSCRQKPESLKITLRDKNKLFSDTSVRLFVSKVTFYDDLKYVSNFSLKRAVLLLHFIFS